MPPLFISKQISPHCYSSFVDYSLVEMLVQGTTSYIGTNVGNQVLNRMMGSYKDDMQKLCTAKFLICYIFLIITPTARKCGPHLML